VVYGTYHPLTIVMRDVVAIFRGMGFRLREGPEIELVKFNFDMLNTPEWHPIAGRVGYDLPAERLVGPHRDLAGTDPDDAVTAAAGPHHLAGPRVSPGPSGCDSLPMFIKWKLVRRRGRHDADLKSTLLSFYRNCSARRRRSDAATLFPFTEPSAEVDISCFFLRGGGCRICKSTGWLEMAGAGCGSQVLRPWITDPETYTGYAFGLGSTGSPCCASAWGGTIFACSSKMTYGSYRNSREFDP